MVKVIALDLEGTLISNAMSQIPRSGLFEFIEACKVLCERTVILPTVKEALFRKIAQQLVSEKLVPEWVEDIEYIHWEGKAKDLNFITDIIHINEVLLVDDFYEYVHLGQESQWIEIKQFIHPYEYSDKELDIILKKLKEK